MANSDRGKKDFQSCSLDELQKIPLANWVARFDGHKLLLENKGFSTMRSKTIYGKAYADWFEMLLRKTMETNQDFERYYSFLKSQYISLIKGLKDILEASWPDAWAGLSNPKPITLGPRKGGNIWNMYGGLWISGTLKYLQKIACLHNELVRTSKVDGQLPLWDPAIFEHKSSSQPVKSGLFVVDMQDVILFPGGPASLEKEIRRLSEFAAGGLIEPPGSPPDAFTDKEEILDANQHKYSEMATPQTVQAFAQPNMEPSFVPVAAKPARRPPKKWTRILGVVLISLGFLLGLSSISMMNKAASRNSAETMKAKPRTGHDATPPDASSIVLGEGIVMMGIGIWLTVRRRRP